MIPLAVEIPVGMPEIRDLTDFDFVLGHEVLENPEYRALYAERNGRYMMLDNGFHELGKPLTPVELVESVKQMQPNCVISPDNFKDAKFTLEMYKELTALLTEAELERPPRIGVVLSGETERERSLLYAKLRHPEIVWCLPYRVDRLEWFNQLNDIYPDWSKYRNVHLLGWRNPMELEFWGRLARVQNITMDTSKPVKWGILGEHLNEVEEIRGAKVDSDTLVKRDKFTVEQRAATYYNIGWLKRMSACF